MVAPLRDRSFINADSANLVIVPEAIGFNYSGLESDPDYSVAVAEPNHANTADVGSGNKVAHDIKALISGLENLADASGGTGGNVV
jgi:hypothetical protein